MQAKKNIGTGATGTSAILCMASVCYMLYALGQGKSIKNPVVFAPLAVAIAGALLMIASLLVRNHYSKQEKELQKVQIKQNKQNALGEQKIGLDGKKKDALDQQRARQEGELENLRAQNRRLQEENLALDEGHKETIVALGTEVNTLRGYADTANVMMETGAEEANKKNSHLLGVNHFWNADYNVLVQVNQDLQSRLETLQQAVTALNAQKDKAEEEANVLQVENSRLLEQLDNASRTLEGIYQQKEVQQKSGPPAGDWTNENYDQKGEKIKALEQEKKELRKETSQLQHALKEANAGKESAENKVQEFQEQITQKELEIDELKEKNKNLSDYKDALSDNKLLNYMVNAEETKQEDADYSFAIENLRKQLNEKDDELQKLGQDFSERVLECMNKLLSFEVERQQEITSKLAAILQHINVHFDPVEQSYEEDSLGFGGMQQSQYLKEQVKKLHAANMTGLERIIGELNRMNQSESLSIDSDHSFLGVSTPAREILKKSPSSNYYIVDVSLSGDDSSLTTKPLSKSEPSLNSISYDDTNSEKHPDDALQELSELKVQLEELQNVLQESAQEKEELQAQLNGRNFAFQEPGQGVAGAHSNDQDLGSMQSISNYRNVDAMQERNSTLVGQVDCLTKEVGKLQEQNNNLTEQLNRDHGPQAGEWWERNTHDAEMRKKDAEIQELQTQREEVTQQQDTLEQEKNKLEEDLKNVQAELENTKKASEEQRQTSEGNEEKIADLTHQVEHFKRQLKKVEESVQYKEGELQQVRQGLNEAQGDLKNEKQDRVASELNLLHKQYAKLKECSEILTKIKDKFYLATSFEQSLDVDTSKYTVDQMNGCVDKFHDALSSDLNKLKESVNQGMLGAGLSRNCFSLDSLKSPDEEGVIDDPLEQVCKYTTQETDSGLSSLNSSREDLSCDGRKPGGKLTGDVTVAGNGRKSSIP